MTRQEHLLVCLAEECAEVQKEITKILRFGLNDKPIESLGGKNLEPNSVRLHREVVDVLAVIDMLMDEGLIEDVDVKDVEAKQERVEKYMKYAHEKGMLDVK